MKATIFILNGKPVASVNKRPEPFISAENLARIASGELTAEAYVKAALHEWRSECMEIENYSHRQRNSGIYYLSIKGFKSLLPFSIGQKAEIQKTALGCIVTKIL